MSTKHIEPAYNTEIIQHCPIISFQTMECAWNYVKQGCVWFKNVVTCKDNHSALTEKQHEWGLVPDYKALCDNKMPKAFLENNKKQRFSE